MSNIRLSKHDKYVMELSNKIKDNYDSISVNVPIKHSKRSLGEIDIIAQKTAGLICTKSNARIGSKKPRNS